MLSQKHFNNSWRSSPRFYDSRNLGGWNFGNLKLGGGEIEVGEESFVFISLFDTVEIGEKLFVYDRVSDVVESCVSFASKILTHHRMH